MAGGILEKLADALGGLADSTVGAGLETLVGAAWKELADAYRAHGGLPQTDDLERALRLAQLTACCLLVLEEQRREERDAADHRAAPRDPFLPAALTFLRTRIGYVPTLTLRGNDALVSTLNAGLDAALALSGPDSSDRGRAAAEQVVWDELVAGAKAKPGDSFRLRFFGRLERVPLPDDPATPRHEPGWFACFIAFFRAATTRHPSVEIAFTFSRLTETLREARAIRAAQGEAAARHAQRHAELVALIAREKGVPPEPLRAILRRLGEEGTPDEAIPARLAKLAEDFLALRADLDRHTNAPAEVEKLRQRAREALDAGDLPAAAARLAEADDILRESYERMGEERARIIGEAAGVALLGSDYATAVAKRQQAARLVAHDQALEWAQRLAEAGALNRWGEVRADPAHLRQAVATYDVALTLAACHPPG